MKKALSVIRKTKKGISIAEAVIAASVFSIVATSVITGIYSAHKNIISSGIKKKAVFLSQEGLEATRNIRDVDFTRLSNGAHGISRAGSAWDFSGSSDATDSIFSRSVQISSVDTNTKLAISNVQWHEGTALKTVSLSEYLTNWRIAKGGWNNPSIGECLDFSGNSDGLKVQVSGNYAYAIAANSSDSFRTVDISNPSNVSLLVSFSLSSQSNPSDLAVSGNYAYVASAHNSEELQVVDISNHSSPSKVGIYSASGNADGRGIFVSGSTAYLSRASSSDDEIYTINISNPSSPSSRDSLNLSAAGNDIVKIGNYAYVASDANAAEIKIINVADAGNISNAGSYDLAGSDDVLSVTGFGSTLLVGRSNGFLYIFDISNPTSPVLRGQFDAGGSVNDMALGKDNASVFLATSAGTKELQVVNILDTANPTLLGSLNMSGNLNGVAYNLDLDATFTTGASNTEEFCSVIP